MQAIWPSFFSKKQFLAKTTDLIFSIRTRRVLWRGTAMLCWFASADKGPACQWYLLQLNLLGTDSSRCTLACQTLVRPHHAAHRSTSKGEKARGCGGEGEWGKHNPNWGVSLQSQLVWLYSTGIFFTCRFDQRSPQQVLTGTTSWRSRRRALVSFNREND